MGRTLETILVGTHEAWEACTLDNLEAPGNNLQLVTGHLSGTCVIDWDLSGITATLEHIYQAWNYVKPANTTILVEYNLSYDSGLNWEGWETDIELEDILLASDQTDPATFLVKTRITLTTTDAGYQPVMENISLSLYHADNLVGSIQTVTSLDAGLAILKTLQGSMSNQSLLQGTLALRKGLQGTIGTSSGLQGTMAIIKVLQGLMDTSTLLQGSMITKPLIGIQGLMDNDTGIQGSLALIKVIQGLMGNDTGMQGSLALIKVIQGITGNDTSMQGALALTKGIQGIMGTDGTMEGTLALIKVIQGIMGNDTGMNGSLDREPIITLRGTIPTSSALLGDLGYSTIPGEGSFMACIAQDLYDCFFKREETAIRAIYNGTVNVLIVVAAYDTPIQDPEAAGDDQDIEVMVAEVARPVEGDTFTISGKVWHVKRILGGGPELGTWKVRITRSTRRRL